MIETLSSVITGVALMSAFLLACSLGSSLGAAHRKAKQAETDEQPLPTLFPLEGSSDETKGEQS